MVQSAPSPRPRRKPRMPLVIRDPAPEELDAPIDWSDWYLSEQDDVVAAFASALEQLAAAREWSRVRVGRDAFFAWIPSEPFVRISPDVYLLDDPPPPPWPRMWQTWLAGHRPPRFALEVVSEDWKKDYEDTPPKYAMLGTAELVVFDPEAARGVGSPRRMPLQLYRREPDGSFVRTYHGPGPVRVDTLGAWLVARPGGGIGWLRIALDARGVDVVPAASERAEQEAQRAEHEAQRAERLAARLRALGVEPDEGD